MRKYFNFYDLIAYEASINQTYRFNTKFSVNHQIGILPRKIAWVSQAMKMEKSFCQT